MILTLNEGKPVEIRVPHFDPHIHLRKQPMKEVLLGEASKRMCGGIEEPNTDPHLLTCDDVERSVAESHRLAPGRAWSGSIYMTPQTKAAEVKKAWERRLIGHVKRYPPHGSTHSEDSVPEEMLLDINSSAGQLLCFLAEAGIPYKGHNEVTMWQGKKLHPQYREGVWYREFQGRFDDLYRNRGLRQVHAHITSTEAAAYIKENGDPEYRVAELTGHHLIDDWNLQYDDGNLLPDYHWLPVSKDAQNTESLRDLARARLACIMAASDMAGHGTKRKYAARVWGGGYTYHCSLELYIQALEDLGLLDYAEQFLYRNAKAFHKDLVPSEPSPFHLVRENWTVSERVAYPEGSMTPFGFDENPKKRFVFRWKLAA